MTCPCQSSSNMRSDLLELSKGLCLRDICLYVVKDPHGTKKKKKKKKKNQGYIKII